MRTMTEQKELLNVAEVLKELYALKPISVTFKEKPREVHFFHRGTAEAFSDALRGISENESIKQRKQREIRLLAIVLADLNGSSRYFKRIKRWLWRKRLRHSKYSDVEAIALLDAARDRIQNGKRVDALIAILLAHIQVIIASMSVNREQLVVLNESLRKEKAV